MQIVPLDEMRPGDKVVLSEREGGPVEMLDVIHVDDDLAAIVRTPEGERRVPAGQIRSVVRMISPPQEG